MRLVRRHREDHLHGADELAVGERCEHEAPPLFGVCDEAFERGARVRVRERLHVVHRRAARHAVGEDRGQAVEVLSQLGSIEPSDVDLGSHPLNLAQYTPRVLFEPDAHEPLAGEPWNADTIRAAIAAIVADAEDAFDEGWPLHPQDVDDDSVDTRYRGVYIGGAGVVDGLRRLARRGFVDLHRDYVRYLERSLEAEPDFPDSAGSVWMGELGIRLVLQRLAPSAANLERMSELIAANAQDERCEVMWGSPGSILAGRELSLDVTPSLDWLRERRDADGLWTQQLYGQTTRYLGPAHGFAGAALAVGDLADVSETLRPLAVEEDGLVNWPPLAGGGLRSGRVPQIRTQWCHGAPGIVATLAQFLDADLALGGGELTWHAGPLRKGANVCHGTAGNGYAFLALFESTGDEQWLDRARAFAMHAAAQVERTRAEHGRGRYTLWTGDPGTALYLADCIDGTFELPLP